MLEAYQRVQHAWSDVRKVVLVQSEGDTLLYKAVPRLSLVVHAGHIRRPLGRSQNGKTPGSCMWV